MGTQHPIIVHQGARAMNYPHIWKFDHVTTNVRDRLHWLPVQQTTEYKVCVLVYKCLHQHTSLNCAHRCLNQPIVVIYVPLHVVTL